MRPALDVEFAPTMTPMTRNAQQELYGFQPLALISSLAFLTKLKSKISGDFDVALHFGCSFHVVDHRLQHLVVAESFLEHEPGLDVIDRAHQLAVPHAQAIHHVFDRRFPLADVVVQPFEAPRTKRKIFSGSCLILSWRSTIRLRPDWHTRSRCRACMKPSFCARMLIAVLNSVAGIVLVCSAGKRTSSPPITTRLTSFSDLTVFPQDLARHHGERSLRRHDPDVFAAQLCHRLDVRHRNQIPSGLVLEIP